MSRKGCSNRGKYSGVSSDLFCGPAGGSCEGTYPVNTPGRAIAALSYARYAPNPEGIRTCARKIAKEKGWMNSEGKIVRSSSRKKEKVVYIRGRPHSVISQGKKVTVTRL